jgi:hypothetical protein
MTVFNENAACCVASWQATPSPDRSVVAQLSLSINVGYNVIDVSRYNIQVTKGNIIGYYSTTGVIGWYLLMANL